MKKLIYLIAIFSTPVFAMETIECNFTSYSNERGNSKGALKLTFIFSEPDKKAYVVDYSLGYKDRREVKYIKRTQSKTFIYSPSFFGNNSITFISEKLDAVHSDHNLNIKGELYPSQHYGSCVKK